MKRPRLINTDSLEDFPLGVGETTIGRNPGCKIVIKDRKASAHHASVTGDFGAEIKDAVSNATTAERTRDRARVDRARRWDGGGPARDGLMKSVQGFQPTVEALSGAVGDAQRTVADAVAKLNAHEAVMQEMAGAAV